MSAMAVMTSVRMMGMTVRMTVRVVSRRSVADAASTTAGVGRMIGARMTGVMRLVAVVMMVR